MKVIKSTIHKSHTYTAIGSSCGTSFTEKKIVEGLFSAPDRTSVGSYYGNDVDGGICSQDKVFEYCTKL